MNTTFEHSVDQWLRQANLLRDKKKVLLAVSGGADSVAMCHMFAQLRKAGSIQSDLVVGHIDHNLRGAESDADQQFVQQLAESFGLRFVTRSVSVCEYAKEHKQSIETAGRYLRIQSLIQMAREYGCDAIATAHHADDQIETIIHRLQRGTGFRGLAGIRPEGLLHGMRFVRPLLVVHRTQIEQYLTEQGIIWRQDHTNDQLAYTRNRIRHRLIPYLTGHSSDLKKRLSELASASGRFLDKAEQQADMVFAKGQNDKNEEQFILEKVLVKDLSPWVFYELIRRVLIELGAGLRDYTQTHFRSIYQLVHQKKGVRNPCFRQYPDGIQVSIEKGGLKLIRGAGGLHPPICSESVPLQIGKTVSFGSYQIFSEVLHANQVSLDEIMTNEDSNVECLDAEKIVGPTQIRCRKDGDRFWPLGGKGEKKVARFLQDSGLNAEIRKNAVIIEDAQKILWLAPIRLAEHPKVTPVTVKILQIRLDCASGHST